MLIQGCAKMRFLLTILVAQIMTAMAASQEAPDFGRIHSADIANFLMGNSSVGLEKNSRPCSNSDLISYLIAAKKGLSTIPSFDPSNGSIGVHFGSARATILVHPLYSMRFERNDTRDCVDWINQLLLEYSKTIQAHLVEEKLPWVVYVDIYEGFMVILTPTRVYGLPHKKYVCCGRSRHHASSGRSSTNSAWSGEPLAHVCDPTMVQDLMSRSKALDSRRYHMLKLQALEADEIGFHSSSLSLSKVVAQERPGSALTPYLTGPNRQIFNTAIILRPTVRLNDFTHPVVSLQRKSFVCKLEVGAIRDCIQEYHATLPESVRNDESTVFLSIVRNNVISNWYIGDMRNTTVLNILSGLQIEPSKANDSKWNALGIVLLIVGLAAIGGYTVYRKWKGVPEQNLTEEPSNVETESGDEVDLLEALETKKSNCETSVPPFWYDESVTLANGRLGTSIHSGTYLGRPAAIKCTLLSESDRAENEVKLLRELEYHPNIVHFYWDTKNEDKEKFYLILGLALGNLSQLILEHSQHQDSELFGKWVHLQAINSILLWSS